MKKLLKMQTLSIYIALLAIIALFSILSPTFLSVSNALTILRQISSLGIMAMGMMFVMLLGNVDLSVGTSVSLIGICMAYFMVNMHLSIGVTVLLGIAIGLVIDVYKRQNEDSDPDAIWAWGMIGADFICEDGEWKIWHFHYFRYIKCLYEKGWVEDTSMIHRLNTPVHPMAKPTTYHNPYSRCV